MEVYIELALAENFCMDFCLLYAAKKITKNRAKIWRIVLGAAVGAAFAVLFPLMGLSGVWAVAVKLLSGFAICVLAGRFSSVKSYIKFAGIFLLAAALLGGALIGVFWLAGWEYISGQGFLISSVPIGIPLFGVLMIILGAKRLALRLSKTDKKEVKCRIYAGERDIEVVAFYDSGNKVYCRGAPVSVVSEEVFTKLGASADQSVKIHTVAGSSLMRVFTADKIEIANGENKKTINKVMFGVSPQKIVRAVLHTDLMED